MKKIFAVVFLVLFITGCSTTPPSVIPPAKEMAPTGNPTADQNELTTLVQGNSEFGLDILRLLRKENDNVIFSPLSISTALAMAESGAREDTLSQMRDTLHINLPEEKLHPLYHRLNTTLEENAKNSSAPSEFDYELAISNALWGDKNESFLKEYLDIMDTHYDSGLTLMDFMNAPDESRIKINRWVEEQTHEKIKDLLAEGSINSATSLVITNTVYLKAAWQEPFQEENTRNADFYLLDKSPVSVPFMQNTADYAYSKESGADAYTAVVLPCKEGKLAMLVIMPDDPETFIENLNAEKLQQIRQSMNYTHLNLSFPKYKNESSFSLATPLQQLGMKNAFDPLLADFSGMTGKRSLYISDAIHKAFIDVDEKGTEAAAATAIIIAKSAMPGNEPITAKFDHPFIYFMMDQETQSILFMGQMSDPSKN